MSSSLSKRLIPEFIGTFWLVLGGTGTAVLAANVMGAGGKQIGGVGWVGVALAFGLTVLTGAYALGAISGGHFNPAVSLGLLLGKRFPAKDLVPYWVVQVAGGIAASAIVYVIASGRAGFSAKATGFATNGYGRAGLGDNPGGFSPAGYSLAAAIVAEVVLTAVFILVIHGVTDRRAPAGLAALAIGLTLTLIHLISIPVTNTSVNPARSIAPALFAGGTALTHLWVFIVFPLLGGAIGGLIWRYAFEEPAAADTDAAID
jgi:aquaporin Z